MLTVAIDTFNINPVSSIQPVGLPGLKALRTSKGLSRDKLARMIDCTGGAIFKMEAGSFGVKQETLARLCEALGCTPNDLLMEVAS